MTWSDAHEPEDRETLAVVQPPDLPPTLHRALERAPEGDECQTAIGCFSRSLQGADAWAR